MQDRDDLLRAFGGAVSAAYTLILIDVGDIVHYMDGIVLAGLLTEMTGDAADLAD